MKGDSVHTAANGGEAVLTEVPMPGMGVKALADRLFRKMPELKVRYMPGYA